MENPKIEGHWTHGGHHWGSYIKVGKINPAAAAFLKDYHSGPHEELYHIDQDPFDRKNLSTIAEFIDKLASLREMV